jgi:hypothetical protein
VLITMDERAWAADGSWTWVNDPATTSTAEEWLEANDGDPEVAEAIEKLNAGEPEVWLGGGAAPLTRLRFETTTNEEA